MEVNNSIPGSITIERSVFEQFVNHTLRHSENEWGGLLISRIVNGEIQCIASVLPPQKVQSPGYCEFKKELFTAVRAALEKIESKYHDENFQIMTWIHTHPGLGVFLSTTDHSTFSYLGKLNPSITAVVVDPVQYEWLGVNSRPGDTYGFTSLVLNLDLLLANGDSDPKLGEKLDMLRASMNSDLSKKMLQLSPKDKIEVFVPISIDKLLREIISSNLNGIGGLLARVKKKLFAMDANITIPDKKEKKPEIQELVNYIMQFRGLEREIRGWRSLQVNKELLSMSIMDYAERQPDLVSQIVGQMRYIAKLIGGLAVLQMSLWDDVFQYNDSEASKRVRWSNIKSLEIEEIHEEARIIGISFKRNLFSGWQYIITFMPDIEKFTDIIKTKVDFQKGTRITDAFKAQVERREDIKRKKQERAEKENKAQTDKEAGKEKKKVAPAAKTETTGKTDKERVDKVPDRSATDTLTESDKKAPEKKPGKEALPGKKDVNEKGGT